MLPGSSCECWSRWMMSMVSPCVGRGDDHAAASACALGPAGSCGTRSALPDHPRRRDPYPLSDGAAVGPGPQRPADRHPYPPQRRHRPAGVAPLPGRWARRGAAPATSGAATPLPARVGGRAGPGRRSGSPRGRGGQCAVELSAAGRLPGRGDRPPGGDRDGPAGVAPGGVCVQAAPLGAVAQGAGAAGVGKKRVEALLAAAAASAVPPPAGDLVPDATLADELFPEDLPRLLGLLERADLYLQDEVEVALHPTLTRVWS